MVYGRLALPGTGSQFRQLSLLRCNIDFSITYWSLVLLRPPEFIFYFFRLPTLASFVAVLHRSSATIVPNKYGRRSAEHPGKPLGEVVLLMHWARALGRNSK